MKAVGARLRLLAALAIVLSLAALGGTMAYVSGEIYKSALHVPAAREKPDYQDAVIASIDDSSVTLRPDKNHPDRSEQPGIWGLEWAGGYGRLGRILGRRGVDIRREFARMRGALRVGSGVSLDHYAFSGTPWTCLNRPYKEVRVPTELGRFPAWLVPGPRKTWVLFVHGKGGGREEALRAAEIVAALGYPCLVITYRNDPEAEPSEDHRYHYGTTEWKDLDAAARYALAHGAEDLVIVGYSFGGGVVVRFLSQSSQGRRVRGLILEAPCVRLDAALDLGLRGFRLPVLHSAASPVRRERGQEAGRGSLRSAMVFLRSTR